MESRYERQKELLVNKSWGDTKYVGNLLWKEQVQRGHPLSTGEALSIIGNRVVCPKCESFALRSQGHEPEHPVCECGNCGYKGPSMLIEEYIRKGYYK